MITTTLRAIRECRPCENEWKKLRKHCGRKYRLDDPLPFAVILESNGLDAALWATRTAPEYDREWRLYAVWCARKVQHERADPRSLAAMDVAERFANGKATEAELDTASAAASAAASDTAWTASDTAWAASAAAWAAASAVNASGAASAAREAQRVRFLDVASAAREAQRVRFLEVVSRSLNAKRRVKK